MKQDHQRIRDLFLRYHQGRLSGMEADEFWGYVVDPSFEPLIKQLLAESFDSEKKPMALDEETSRRILTRIYQHDNPAFKAKRLKWLPYAAAAAIILAIGSWFLLQNPAGTQGNEQVQYLEADVQPGGNRAVLTLADGRTIHLSEDQSEIVLSGQQITYKDGNPLVELDTGSQLPGSADWLELATPLGGTYQVTLPDGTRVWLNAGSTLRYPSRFDHDERVVELVGEAFFDVAQLRTAIRKVPFLVKTIEQTVNVIGTQFNLKAYVEDGNVKTTLVEGLVRVESVADGYTLLRPGEQSIAEAGKVTVSAVDVQPFIAWKEGYFHFKNTPFPDVIAQLARWYRIDLVYKADVPNQTFSGKMSRNVTLQNVLVFFEGSGIKAKLTDDNKLIIE